MAGNEAGAGIEQIAGAEADLESLRQVIGTGPATALLAANALPTASGHVAAAEIGELLEAHTEGAGTAFKAVIKEAFGKLGLNYNARGELADEIAALSARLGGSALEGASRTRPPLEAVMGLLASWGVGDEADQQAAAVQPAQGLDPDPAEGQGADPADDAPGPNPEIVLSPARERYEAFLLALVRANNFTISDPQSAGGVFRQKLGFSPNEWAGATNQLGNGSESNPGLGLYEMRMHSPKRAASYTLLPEKVRLHGDADYIARQVLPELERRLAELEQLAAAK